MAIGATMTEDRNEDQWRAMRACLERIRPGSPAIPLGQPLAA